MSSPSSPASRNGCRLQVAADAFTAGHVGGVCTRRRRWSSSPGSSSSRRPSSSVTLSQWRVREVSRAEASRRRTRCRPLVGVTWRRRRHAEADVVRGALGVLQRVFPGCREAARGEPGHLLGPRRFANRFDRLVAIAVRSRSRSPSSCSRPFRSSGKRVTTSGASVSPAYAVRSTVSGPVQRSTGVAAVVLDVEFVERIPAPSWSSRSSESTMFVASSAGPLTSCATARRPSWSQRCSCRSRCAPCASC